MKVLLDTNVVLDLLLDREEFSNNAKEIFTLIEEKTIEGFLCATTITTIFYLLNKYLSKENAKDTIKTLLEIFNVAEVNKTTLLNSLDNSGLDYEDSVIYTSAEPLNIDYIITRDLKGFKNSKVKTTTPKEFLNLYRSKS